MPFIQFHTLLRKRVEDEIEAETKRLVVGYPNFDVYREQVGYLRGLQTVLDLADEIERGMT